MVKILDLYKYTDKEREELAKSIVILVDTREQKWEHIRQYFEKKGIKYKSMALSNGDYSFYIPKNEELNIPRDIYFNKKIVIERKANLEELSNNLTHKRAEFIKEVVTYQGQFYLLMEKSTYGDIIEQNYNTKLTPKSYANTLHSLSIKHNVHVVYMEDNDYSGAWIYNTLYSFVKCITKK